MVVVDGAVEAVPKMGCGGCSRRDPAALIELLWRAGLRRADGFRAARRRRPDGADPVRAGRAGRARDDRDRPLPAPGHPAGRRWGSSRNQAHARRSSQPLDGFHATTDADDLARGPGQGLRRRRHGGRLLSRDRRVRRRSPPRRWCSTSWPTRARPRSSCARSAPPSRPTPPWPAGSRCGGGGWSARRSARPSTSRPNSDALTELIVNGSGDLYGVLALINRITERHTERMQALGLNS